MGKLTALDVTRKGPGFWPDGDGLYLQVTGSGARSWIYRFTLAGKTHYPGLGSAKAISLKRARELAAEARRLRAEGIDPLEHRRSERMAKRVESAKAMTFRQCTDAYIASHEAGWRNPKHRQQWSNTLATYAFPVLGPLPVQAIDTALVMKVVEPLWASKPETASRVRGRIESILDWARVRGYREGENNPARWRGHLDHLLPARRKVRKVQHHAALPYREIPIFMAGLRDRQSISARCLEFTILTAARTGEAIAAKWDEINLAEKILVVPGARMKSGREHRIPLAPRALEIIRDLRERRESEYLFPGQRNGQPLSNMAMLKMLALLGRDGVTTHGFRSTFKDWARDCTNFPNEVSEAALAHVVGDKTEAAYARGDLFAKRAKLMAAWDAFCTKPASDAGKVLPLHG
jgi:integrase